MNRVDMGKLITFALTEEEWQRLVYYLGFAAGRLSKEGNLAGMADCVELTRELERQKTL